MTFTIVYALPYDKPLLHHARAKCSSHLEILRMCRYSTFHGLGTKVFLGARLLAPGVRQLEHPCSLSMQMIFLFHPISSPSDISPLRSDLDSIHLGLFPPTQLNSSKSPSHICKLLQITPHLRNHLQALSSLFLPLYHHQALFLIHPSPP